MLTRQGEKSKQKQINTDWGQISKRKKTYGSFFGDFEIANDEIRQLLFVSVTNGDAVVNLFFALGGRPILHTHDLDR